MPISSCGKQRDITKFRYLNNVFEQQYIGKVPALHGATGWLACHQLAPGSWQCLMLNQNSTAHFPIQDTHQSFRASTRRHVEYWQQLFKRCGRQSRTLTGTLANASFGILF
ncbi:DUF3080 domain-containing protein [Vibrio chagasii]|nr:DUF3080 domain-containing protein [Vibrio chagasii]